MIPPKQFWPLYDDQEVEIYDNLSWDLPGRTPRPRRKPSAQRPKRRILSGDR